MKKMYVMELQSKYIGDLNGSLQFSRAVDKFSFVTVQLFLMESPLYREDVCVNTYCIDGDESRQEFRLSLIKFVEYIFSSISVEDDLKTVLEFETSNFDKIQFIFRQYEVM